MKISAILLVGGKGTRLMPLTQHTPKPMLEVAGVPFTEHQIRKAAKAGISEIVLATSYKAELFEPYFGDGEKFGIKIKYAVETTALGTGGGIKNAAELIEACDQVVVFNGDVLSGHDLSNQIKLHQRNNADVTLYLTEVLDARAYGCVEIENNNRVKSFLEKMDNPISNLINAGCYIFNPTIINTIPKGQVVSVERETFPIIEPDTSDLLPTTTSEPITEPFLIKAVGDICAVFDINTSPLCSGVAADSIFPITKSADAFTKAAGVPISNQ